MAARDGAQEGRALLRGAGLAGLSRLGAVIEIATQSLFIWLVGVPAFGLYAALWAGIVLASTVTDFAMTNALQRVVPSLEDAAAHAAVKLALLVTVGAATLVAALLSWQPQLIAGWFSAAIDQREDLPLYVAGFAWALPLWMFVELATAALRARRAFGPEIRIRVFWEQVVRMACALAFFVAGAGAFTLFAAHLASLILAAAMCLRLLGRYYDLPLLLRAPIDRRLASHMLLTGAALFPSNLARRALIHGPALALNVMLGGAQGAAASGLFEVARRIATVPYFVRQSFEYVLAPLSAASAATRRAEVAALYGLATRMIAALVLPLSALLIFAGRDVLSLYRPEVIAALPLLVILVVGRTCDALAGPAQTVVEMTAHRGLPLVNSGLGIVVWLALASLLVPTMAGLGMAIAVAAATTTTAWAAVLQLRSLHGAGVMRRLWRCVAIVAAACGAMYAIEAVLGGPLRFAGLVAVWLGTTWLTLRWGLEAHDKQALGRVAQRLRL